MASEHRTNVRTRSSTDPPTGPISCTAVAIKKSFAVPKRFGQIIFDTFRSWRCVLHARLRRD